MLYLVECGTKVRDQSILRDVPTMSKSNVGAFGRGSQVLCFLLMVHRILSYFLILLGGLEYLWIPLRTAVVGILIHFNSIPKSYTNDFHY